MGIFKEIFNNFMDKLHLDITGTIDKEGAKFSITRKEDESSSGGNGVFQLNVMGYGNPFGGMLITVLESKVGKLLIPKITDDASMFVMLNGLLLPEEEEKKPGAVLWNYLKDKSDNNPPAGLSRLYYRTVKKQLGHNMSVTYWHIPASEIHEYVINGEFDDKVFMDIVSDHVAIRMLPEDMTMDWMIDPHDESSFMRNLLKNTNPDYPAERKRLPLEYDKEEFVSISHGLTLYIYSNILNDIKQEVEEELKIKLGDIPYDPEGQKAFLEGLEKKLKPEKWNKLVERWVV